MSVSVVNVHIHQENPLFVFANNTDSNAIESLTTQQQQQQQQQRQRWYCITEMSARAGSYSSLSIAIVATAAARYMYEHLTISYSSRKQQFHTLLSLILPSSPPHPAIPSRAHLLPIPSSRGHI